MENMLILLILFAVIGLAIDYVIRSKKKGRKCIGCPGGCENCSGGCHAFAEADTPQK